MSTTSTWPVWIVTEELCALELAVQTTATMTFWAGVPAPCLDLVRAQVGLRHHCARRLGPQRQGCQHFRARRARCPHPGCGGCIAALFSRPGPVGRWRVRSAASVQAAQRYARRGAAPDLLASVTLSLDTLVALFSNGRPPTPDQGIATPSTPPPRTSTAAALLESAEISPPVALLRSPQVYGLTKTYLRNEFCQPRVAPARRINTSRLPGLHVTG